MAAEDTTSAVIPPVEEPAPPANLMDDVIASFHPDRLQETLASFVEDDGEATPDPAEEEPEQPTATATGEPENAETTTDMGRSAPVADTPTPGDDGSVEQILERYKNDPVELAKAYANLQKMSGRQSNELGELRTRVEEIAARVAAPESAVEDSPADTPSYSPNGFLLDEYGIEIVPPEYWATTYTDAVAAEYIKAGYDEDEAKRIAPMVAEGEYRKWLFNTEQKRNEAINIRGRETEQAIMRSAEEQKTRLETEKQTLKRTISPLIPEQHQDAFISNVLQKAAGIVKTAVDTNEITQLEAASAEIVPIVIGQAIGQMFVDGTLEAFLGSILDVKTGLAAPAKKTGNAFATVSGNGSGSNGVTPGARDSKGSPTAQDRALAKALGITPEEALADRLALDAEIAKR